MNNISQIALIGGLVLSALTILSNIVITWINKRNEFNKEMHKTVIECAYKEWEETGKRMIEIAPKEGKQAVIYHFQIIYYTTID